MNYLKIIVCSVLLMSCTAEARKKSVCYSINKNLKKQCPYKTILQNSLWVVPPQTLLSYHYSGSTYTAESDQTVWVINVYKHGYFFGQAYTLINNTTRSLRNMIGTITPCGSVYITFYSTDGESSSNDLVTGLGKMICSYGNPLFIMQMNSAQGGADGLSHWSYMTKVYPNDCWYQKLPGVGISVPDFINQFNS